MLFLLGINLFLRAVDEHYNLRREMPTQPSQLQFEDRVSKTHDGGLKDMRNERKEVWIFPHADPLKCPVRLVEKYLNLCPLYYKKSNFYLQALQRRNPKQWFAEQVIGVHMIGKVTVNLMELAKIPGFFTNHSLRG